MSSINIGSAFKALSLASIAVAVALGSDMNFPSSGSAHIEAQIFSITLFPIPVLPQSDTINGSVSQGMARTEAKQAARFMRKAGCFFFRISPIQEYHLALDPLV
jgi:hypothetical protein